LLRRCGHPLVGIGAVDLDGMWVGLLV
jgi:hypothetical protein